MNCYRCGVGVICLMLSMLCLSAKQMALTFDDLPSLEGYASAVQVQKMNHKILNVLASQNIPAVGFVNEGKVSHRGENRLRTQILMDWVASGEELGNHTYSHSKLSQMSVKDFQKDILQGEKTAQLAMDQRNTKIRFFRYPFLDKGLPEQRPPMQAFLKAHGYTEVGITIDSRDWEYNAKLRSARERNPNDSCREIKLSFLSFLQKQLEGKQNSSQPDILLLHVCTLTSECLPQIIELARRHGYEFCSLASVYGLPELSPSTLRERKNRLFSKF